MFRGYRRHLIASVSSDAIGALALRFVRNGLIEKLDARGALVDDNDPNIPVIRPSIRMDTDIVFYLTQPAASVNAVDFRDLAFGSVIAHSPADAHVV